MNSEQPIFVLTALVLARDPEVLRPKIRSLMGADHPQELHGFEMYRSGSASAIRAVLEAVLSEVTAVAISWVNKRYMVAGEFVDVELGV